MTISGEDREIFCHGETRKDAALLRHIAYTETRDFVRLQSRNIPPVIDDAARARLEIAHSGQDCGRLACAVAAEQTDHLTFAHRERNAAQCVAITIIGVNAIELEHVSAASPNRLRARGFRSESHQVARSPKPRRSEAL